MTKVNDLAEPGGSTSLKFDKNLAWNRSIAVSRSNLVEALPLLLLKSLLNFSRTLHLQEFFHVLVLQALRVLALPVVRKNMHVQVIY